ncbi:MAG: hypothetical protein XD36_0218 [Halomonas sp. 54_146]|nr:MULTISPECIES: hypothetical protein [unclassified Halomonas]KUJ89262.1 MAG: hypothetical protein XD36_0218 [Halomonas sp. 54_146]HAA46499.1 hypothetical protein [Halomonas sp.]
MTFEALATLLVGGVVGFLAGVARLRYERAWSFKNDHYRSILVKLDEIRSYAGDAEIASLPAGSALTDKSPAEIRYLIASNVNWLAHHHSIASLFISAEATHIIDEYVKKAKQQEFDWVEHAQMGGYDDTFLSDGFRIHKTIVQGTINNLTPLARKDLRLSLLSRLRWSNN